MKNLILTILTAILCGCSNDEQTNCNEEKQAISEKYQNKIQYVIDHPSINGIDYQQISLLKKEKDIKISNTCN